MTIAGKSTVPGLGPAWTARAQSMEIFGANEDFCSRVFSHFSGLSLLALSGHLAQRLSLQCFTPLCAVHLGFTGSDQGPPSCHRVVELPPKSNRSLGRMDPPQLLGAFVPALVAVCVLLGYPQQVSPLRSRDLRNSVNSCRLLFTKHSLSLCADAENLDLT